MYPTICVVIDYICFAYVFYQSPYVPMYHTIGVVIDYICCAYAFYQRPRSIVVHMLFLCMLSETYDAAHSVVAVIQCTLVAYL